MVASLKAMRKAVVLSFTAILTPATMLWLAYHHAKLANEAEKSDGLNDFGFMHHMARVAGAIIAMFVVPFTVMTIFSPSPVAIVDNLARLFYACAIGTIVGAVINLITWYLGLRFFHKRPEAQSSMLGKRACKGMIASCYLGFAGSVAGLLLPVVTWPIFVVSALIMLGMVIQGLGEAARTFTTLADELSQGTQPAAVPYFQITPTPAGPTAPGQYVPSNQVRQQATGVRYCAFCGTPVPADGQHAYCPQCGAAIQE